jgi:hypothetical protein
LRELAAVRQRFGYRRLHILLAREGITMNHKKLRRLYREERLQVRRRGGRKRALGTRAPMAIPQGANQRWSLDFLSDALADSRRFRILAIVDDFTWRRSKLLPLRGRFFTGLLARVRVVAFPAGIRRMRAGAVANLQIALRIFA